MAKPRIRRTRSVDECGSRPSVAGRVIPGAGIGWDSAVTAFAAPNDHFAAGPNGGVECPGCWGVGQVCGGPTGQTALYFGLRVILIPDAACIYPTARKRLARL